MGKSVDPGTGSLLAAPNTDNIYLQCRMLHCAWRIWEWQRERIYLKFSLSMCVRVLYSCFCASSQVRNRFLGTERARSLCRLHQNTKHLLQFSAFTSVTLFLPSVAIKGNNGWVPSPFMCVCETLSWLCHTHTHAHTQKSRLKNVWRRPHSFINLSMCSPSHFSRCTEKHMGVHFLSSTETRSENSDGSHK